MKNKLKVIVKKLIYLNGHQLIADSFDYVYEYKGYLIAYNSNHLVIISSKGDLILSEEGKVWQVCNSGEYISFLKDNTMGVYLYDGTIFLPFEFYAVFIFDKMFMVKRNKDDEFFTYKQQ